MNTENNKLIAEFLGFQETKLGWYDYEEVLATVETDNTFDSLKFDTDWNWLMGVVEEIEGIEGEDRFSRFNVNILQSWVEVIECHTSEEIVEADCDTKIQSVYKAVVNFIKWYNEQKRN